MNKNELSSKGTSIHSHLFSTFIITFSRMHKIKEKDNNDISNNI